uniref:Uncharacterized protein n=1 Tax=Acanthochromis polyacanthus TaxID=80966 RepID=A0A3Q1H093_9TELE
MRLLLLGAVAWSGSVRRRSSGGSERRRGSPMTSRKSPQHPPTFSNQGRSPPPAAGLSIGIKHLEGSTWSWNLPDHLHGRF